MGSFVIFCFDDCMCVCTHMHTHLCVISALHYRDRQWVKKSEMYFFKVGYKLQCVNQIHCVKTSDF